MIAHLVQEFRKFDGIGKFRARMARHEIRHEILLLAQAFVHAREAPHKFEIDLAVRLAHQPRHAIRDVLGRDLQLAADMILAELFEKIIIREQQVVEADARAHENLFDARHGTELAQELQVIAVISHEILARLRRKTRLAAAGAALELAIARRTAEIRRRAADIMDVALESRQLRQNLCFAQQRCMAPALDDAPFVRDDRTEIAATEAAALRDEAELHLFDGWHTAHLLVDGMIRPHVRQIVDFIHLRFRERHGRRVLHDTPFAILLGKPLAANRILLEVFLFERGRKSMLVAPHVVKRRQFSVIVDVIKRRHAEARPRDILDGIDRHALMQVRRDLKQRLFAHAIDEQVGHAVDEQRPAYLVRPVVIVRETPKARLDATDDNRHIGIELTQAVRIDDGRALRPMAALAARRIRILMALLLRRRELVQERIHVARRNEKGKARLAEAVEIPR